MESRLSQFNGPFDDLCTCVLVLDAVANSTSCLGRRNNGCNNGMLTDNKCFAVVEHSNANIERKKMSSKCLYLNCTLQYLNSLTRGGACNRVDLRVLLSEEGKRVWESRAVGPQQFLVPHSFRLTQILLE